MKILKVHYLLALFLPVVSAAKIESCGSSEPAIAHAITLARSLMTTSLLDVRLDVHSIYGYRAMYKVEIFKKFLRDLMTHILHLSTIQVAGRDQEPTFVCAQHGIGLKYDIDFDPLTRCAETGKTSFWVKKTALVFICPSFSTLVIRPFFAPDGPWDIYCPLVQHNVFVGQSDPLVKYQIYDLVYQLAHLYMQDTGLTDETVPKEVTDWNACVGLGWSPYQANPSVRNPFNLVYYVACKYCLVHTWDRRQLMGGSRQSRMHRDAGPISATILAANCSTRGVRESDWAFVRKCHRSAVAVLN